SLCYSFLCYHPSLSIFSLLSLHDALPILRHGIPHAIAAGLYLGLGEGVWLTGYQNAYAASHDGKRWSAERVSSALWVATTVGAVDRKSTRLNSSHVKISYAVFCLKQKRRR